MLDMPLGPPAGAAGGGGGAGLPPGTGAPEEGRLVGSGEIGSLPAGWLKDGCSGGLGSDMASLSEGATDLWRAHARAEGRSQPGIWGDSRRVRAGQRGP